MVQSIARQGRCDERALADAITALFAEGGDALALYGGQPARLHRGVVWIERIFSGSVELQEARPMLTYAANLIALEKRLRHRPETLRTLAEGLDRIHKQLRYFGDPLHDNVIAAIATLYGETISRMKPRVVVRGRREYLQQPGNTQRVRALLLSGLRGAHCWHKAGGSHLRLLLGRGALLREARALRREQFGSGAS
ncbi:MAG: DUF489 family protein [Zetaproteobacteria bacterium]|nr:MAG: DUF489 family protein [Zetaproteobacteria bacterium]